METPNFPSKRDRWIEIILWAVVFVFSMAARDYLRAAGPHGIGLVALALVMIGGPFILSIIYGTSYTLTDEKLLIHNGPFHSRILLSEIESVTPRRSFGSGPAVSIDRLEIRHAGRRLMISPLDKAGFLAALEKRCRHLELRDDRLVSRPPRPPRRPPGEISH